MHERGNFTCRAGNWYSGFEIGLGYSGIGASLLLVVEALVSVVQISKQNTFPVIVNAGKSFQLLK